MKKSLLMRMIKEEVQKVIKETAVAVPTRQEIDKVLQQLPVGKHATIYGKVVFKVGPDQYVYPAKFVSRADLASSIEREIDQLPDDEVFGADE